MNLRPYQQRAIDNIKRSLICGNRRVGLMLATGGGKTRIAAAIIQGAIDKGKKVIFVVDRKTLVNQSSKAFYEHEIDHGIIQADHPMYRPWESLQVCSIQTLMRRKTPDADLVIIDEFHDHYKHVTKMMQQWSLIPFIGLSATPFTKGLGKHWDDLVIGATTSALIEGGYLVKPVIFAPPSIDTKGLHLQNGDYAKKEVAERVKSTKITADIVDTYLSKGEGRKTILFPANVAHSKDCVNQFNLAGIPSAHIDAHTPDEEREKIFDQLKDGEILLLSSVGVLQKGFDETSVSCIILARPTKSLALYIQMVGRGLRGHEGKEDCIILDHAGNVERLGWPDDPLPSELNNGDKTENQATKENEEKKEAELKPKRCPSCNHLVKAEIFTCPKCDHIFSRKSKVEVESGELKELKRTPPNEKRDFYAQLLYITHQKGYSPGWAAWRFKEKFGHWPAKKAGITPQPPKKEVLNYVKYLQIKWQHSSRKSSKVG